MQVMADMQRCPEFVVWTGPMWSGKSSALLAAIDRYRHQGRIVTVIKPKIDDRYAHDSVVTHGGWKTAATPVNDGLELVRCVADSDHAIDVVAVDELFMIPGGGEALVDVFKTGITVIMASLDLSSSCVPFQEVQAVLPWATRIEKLSAVCAVCKMDARYTWKKTAGLGAIEVGGAETYESRCWTHHPIASMQLQEGTDTFSEGIRS